MPTPVGPVKRKQPAGPLGLRQPGARALDRLRDQVHGFVLAEDDALERFFERAQALAIGGGRLACGNARHPRHDRLDVDGVNRDSGFRRRDRASLQPRDGAGFVDEIDGAVGQAVVAQVPGRELGGGFERRVGVLHAVMLFVAAAQAGQNAHGLFDRRLVDGNLLQAPRQRAVLLDVLELLERRRADDAQIAGREQRLQHRREIHRAAGDGAGADGGVNLVDEENGLRLGAQRLDDGLEALLEVAAEARAREQGAGVEREDLGVLQRVLHVV